VSVGARSERGLFDGASDEGNLSGASAQRATDLPDELLLGKFVQPLRQKHFCFRQTQIRITTSALPQEERIAIVTDVGQGIRWTRRRQARE
jgi:hypothetical protein